MTKNALDWANVLDGGVQSWMDNGLPVNAGLFGATKEAFNQAMAQAWDGAIEAAMAKHGEMNKIHTNTASTMFGTHTEQYKRHMGMALHHQQSEQMFRALPNPYKDKENGR